MDTIESTIEMCTQLGPDQHRGAAERRYCWGVGDVIRVKFVGGNLALHQRVAKVAKQWMEYANIQFAFNVPGPAEVRVDFNPKVGSWSYVGTTCLRVRSRPTMNLGWITATSEEHEFERVVLHEFGHVLGLVHEHSSPVANIPWDEEAVYAYYKQTQRWSRQKTKENVLTPEPADMYTAFDPESIMLYPVSPRLTRNGFSIPWINTDLSDKDKQFVGLLYPFGKRQTAK